MLSKAYPAAKVLTYGKYARGFNLQEYKKTIFYDLTFDYYNYKQSMYRTYRTGQEDVEFVDVISDYWLDSVLKANCERKGRLQDIVTGLLGIDECV